MRPTQQPTMTHPSIRFTTGSVAAALVLTLVTPLLAQEPPAAPAMEAVAIGALAAAPGTRVSGFLPVPAGPDGTTAIPVTILHGTRPGPTLAVIAGIHGSETTPILAVQQLPARVDPLAMAGTLVLIHVANMPSFLGRSIYVSPADGKNLNRQFPGRANGSMSERIAFVLTRDVLSRADAVIDVHSGDANEDLRPWTGYYAKHGTPDLIRRSREMAVAFGLEFVVEFPFAPSADAPTLYTGSTAVRMGKPAFDVEVGRLGRIEPTNTTLIVDGLLNVAQHLGIIEGPANAARQTSFVVERRYLDAEYDGLFFPLVNAGDTVAAGAHLGYITNFHGQVVQELTAPSAGTVLVIVATPPVNKGDEIVTLATALRQ